MAKKIDYRMTRPAGKCKTCTINLWKEHNDGPAPHAMPCPMDECPHKDKFTGQLLQYDRSSTGSPIALLTG